MAPPAKVPLDELFKGTNFKGSALLPRTRQLTSDWT